MNSSLAVARQQLESGGRILVSRLRHLGDVVLSLPLVEVLHERFPHAEVHYLAEPQALGPVLHHPAVSHVWESPRQSLAMWRRAWTLRRQGFAVGIDLFANPRSALLLFASVGGVRLGEDRRVRRHLFTHPRHLVPGRSALEQHLAVLTDMGLDAAAPRRPRIHLTAEECIRARAQRPATPEGERIVLLHVDASHPAKEWPLQHWIDLMQRLTRQGWHVLVGRAPGTPRCSVGLAQRSDVPRQVTFLTARGLRDYLGQVSLCDAVISVDGGILHCSVGLGRPTVGLFGPTDASIWFPYESFGPYRVVHLGRIESRPEPRTSAVGCLAAIDPATVETTLDSVLAAPHQGERA